MKFRREARYIVLKTTDISPALTATEGNELARLIFKIDGYRFKRGKSLLKAVVVEHDWPEYEPVWKMLEERHNKEHSDESTSDSSSELPKG